MNLKEQIQQLSKSSLLKIVNKKVQIQLPNGLIVLHYKDENPLRPWASKKYPELVLCSLKEDHPRLVFSRGYTRRKVQYIKQYNSDFETIDRGMNYFKRMPMPYANYYVAYSSFENEKHTAFKLESAKIPKARYPKSDIVCVNQSLFTFYKENGFDCVVDNEQKDGMVILEKYGEGPTQIYGLIEHRFLKRYIDTAKCTLNICKKNNRNKINTILNHSDVLPDQLKDLVVLWLNLKNIKIIPSLYSYLFNKEQFVEYGMRFNTSFDVPFEFDSAFSELQIYMKYEKQISQDLPELIEYELHDIPTEYLMCIKNENVQDFIDYVVEKRSRD